MTGSKVDVAKNNSASRRRLIRTLALGGTLTASQTIPSKWAKPLIDSVSTPSHAITTDMDCVVGTCSNSIYELYDTSMHISLCVEILVSGTIGDIQDPPNCTLEVGGASIPSCGSPILSDDETGNTFWCCFNCFGIPKESGTVTLSVTTSNDLSCSSNVGFIPNGSFISRLSR